MPSPEVIQKALAAIEQEADRIYFFEHLQSPEWILPLLEAGLFHSPPRPIQEGQYIEFPLWSESRYLARMAHLAPETVLDVALQIPETENVRVHEDLIDAALAMPATLAKEFLPKAKRWIQSPYQLLLPEKLGNLMTHLALDNQVDAAFELARALLTNLTERDTPLESWRSREFLNKHVPNLASVAGISTLELLCDILDQRMHILRENGDESDETTYIWRPSIEDERRDHSQTSFESVHYLISAIRDVAEEMVRSLQAPLREIVSLLEQHDGPIFHRIVLYLLSKFPQEAPELVTEHLADRHQFDDLNLLHEYTLLAHAGMMLLSPERQAKILAWVDQGPIDLEEVKSSYERHGGKPMTDELVVAYVDCWRRNWLARLGPNLPPVWKYRYDQLVETYGPARHPEFAWYPVEITWATPPISPKSVEELSSMSVEDIVGYLQTWQPQPSEDFPSSLPSREGLKSVLTIVIRSDPDRFSERAELFRELDPNYVNVLLTGLEEAAQQKRLHHWPSVLSFCQWILHKGERNSYEDVLTERDPVWAWSRRLVARLLAVGLEMGPPEISFSLRREVWEIVKLLTKDSDPTPEDEVRYGGSNMDPTTLAINTVRGEAMHNVVRYALWVRHYVEQEENGEQQVVQEFGIMPEVREVLDWHLNPHNDPSLAVHSAYGQWFPWLVTLDQTWTIQRIPDIFPSETALYDRYKAAWDAYVIFCRPYNNTFDILRGEYYRAVKLLGMASDEQQHPYDPEEHLAEHLMFYYWSSKVDIYTPEDLLPLFFAHAPEKLRGYIFEFAGRSLYNTDEVDAQILIRLQALWEWRLERIQTPSLSSYTNELAAFGWWFGSGKFDNAWAIQHLEEVLKQTAYIEANHLVAKKLESLVTLMPFPVVRCLALLIKGDERGWVTSSVLDSVRKILDGVFRSGDIEARKAGKGLAKYLVTRGYLDMLDFLSRDEE
jgi:hypothetical protein